MWHVRRKRGKEKKKTFQVSSYRVRNELAVSATLFSSYMHDTHDNKTSPPSPVFGSLLEFIVH